MITSNPARVLAALLATSTIAIGACSDSPVAPRSAAAPSDPSTLLLLSGSGVRITASTTIDGVTYETAIVDPRSNVKLEGDGYSINLPSSSICDPLTSGYGPGTWDAPCRTAVLPITFRVKSWTDSAGNARTEIHPDIRFSPSRTVKLQLTSRRGSESSTSRINWCPTGASTCVDESRNDGSLVVDRDAWKGTVSRRVKHFSGYMVSVGFSGDPSDTTDTTDTEEIE
jgi:hypothetical protein